MPLEAYDRDFGFRTSDFFRAFGLRTSDFPWSFGFRPSASPLVLVLVLVLGLPCPLRAADWLQFRGPHGAGASLETGLRWDLGSPDILAWKVSLPGRGLSSPIVVGDRIFLTAASGPRQEQLHVFCFNAADGTLRWERQFWATGRTMCQEKTCVAAPSPASDGERLYALFSSNDLFCLDLDGNLIWLRGLTRDYPNVSNSLGMASSLVAADGVVVAQVENDSESYALGLDARTGTNLWRLDRPRLATWTSPVLLPGDAAPRLVALQSGKGVTAVEVQTGRVAWTYAEGASTIPSSAAAGEVLFVPSFGLTAIEARPAGTQPRQLWRSGPLRPGTPSPVAVGDRVYVLNDAGVLSCGDTRDGKRLWQLRLKGPISATPVVAENRMLVVSEKGLAQVVDLSKDEGEVIAERDLGETVLGTPAIAHGAIYVRSDRTLWRFGSGKR
jgi:outer membrane protein assembly factor BamB